MLFFAARVVRHPAMQNPTLVLLTDRNDLDDQLFGQMPVQASGRVNRVFRDKPAGLVVDYVGLADELQSTQSSKCNKVSTNSVYGASTRKRRKPLSPCGLTAFIGCGSRI
jgi:type I site-specific restriction-modification system R (restriction) subunit